MKSRGPGFAPHPRATSLKKLSAVTKLRLCELSSPRFRLQEIEVSNQTMLGQIDETKEFINTQLNEARNRWFDPESDFS
jgi:hypothetical protein